MISDIAAREDELPGKTMLIYGLGAIGTRLARLARAFGMRVIGIKRDITQGGQPPWMGTPPEALMALLPQSDFVVLTCPLTPLDPRPHRRGATQGHEAIGDPHQRGARALRQ